MKKAIITFGVGYGFEDIKYFINSCTLHTPDADIYLYVGKNIDELRTQCAPYPRLHLIQYHENFFPKLVSRALIALPVTRRIYPRVLTYLYSGTTFNRSALNALTLPLVQFMVKRFIIIQDLLRTLPHELIMLSDVRDVLLQSNPFRQIDDKTIITGIEPLTNHQSEMNSRWIQKTFSLHELDTLKGEWVACAGVIVGGRKAIDQYVDEMINEVYANLHKILGMLGADQAIHMKLFYQKLTGLNKRFESNGKGSIATLHFSTLNEFDLLQGKISNRINNNLAIVHQYDRHPELAALLKKNIDSEIAQSLTIAA